MKKLLSMADGLYSYKNGDVYTVEDEDGNILKQAKTSRTIQRFVLQTLQERRSKEKLQNNTL